MTGCLREKARIYLVVEAVLLELIGLKATRDYDPSFGFSLLSMDKTLR
jgi:predicted DNA-binding protein with PD1-like motif